MLVNRGPTSCKATDLTWKQHGDATRHLLLDVKKQLHFYAKNDFFYKK